MIFTELGSHPVEPKMDAQNIADLKLATHKPQRDVMALARMLEQGAASACIGQIASLKDPKIAKLFACAAADEAVHRTTLNDAAGTPIPTAAYLFG